MRLMTLTLTAALLASPVLATGEKHDHAKMDHSDMDGIHTTATIHSIDGDVVNLTHPPIPDLRWPAMTMDLMLLDGAEVGDIEAGDDVMLMLEKGEGGMVGIRAMTPAK
jgi:Cu/Ag efflux protein CusF